MTIEHHDSSSATVSPGKLLREAREARGLSQPEVASRLNLRVSLVRDIEQDRFDQRTATTFTRGYLKIYARLVGISEDDVVAAYETLGFVDKPFAEMHSFSGRRRLEANENRLRLFSWLLFIVIGLGVLFWIMGRPAEKPELVKLDDKALLNAASASVTIAPAPVVSEAVALTVSPGVSTAIETAPVANVASSAAVAASSAQTAASAAVVATAVVTEAAASAAVTTVATTDNAVVTMDGDLQIRFTGDCWLEVYDAKNKKLLSGTRKSGQQESLKGEAPFRLTVGAPKHVLITFKGESVDMKRFPIGRVARFQLPLQN